MSRIRNFCIDIETYSDVDLSKCGVYKYVEGDFHILLFAYAFDDEEVKIVDLACGEELPQEVLDRVISCVSPAPMVTFLLSQTKPAALGIISSVWAISCMFFTPMTMGLVSPGANAGQR